MDFTGQEEDNFEEAFDYEQESSDSSTEDLLETLQRELEDDVKEATAEGEALARGPDVEMGGENSHKKRAASEVGATSQPVGNVQCAPIFELPRDQEGFMNLMTHLNPAASRRIMNLPSLQRGSATQEHLGTLFGALIVANKARVRESSGVEQTKLLLDLSNVLAPREDADL